MHRIAIAFLFILCAAVTAAEPAKVVPPEVAKLVAARDASAADFRKKIQAAAVAWCAAADLSAVPVPALGADPRASEVARVEEVRKLNSDLSGYAALMKDAGRWNPETARQVVEDGALPALVARAAQLRAGKP